MTTTTAPAFTYEIIQQGEHPLTDSIARIHISAPPPEQRQIVIEGPLGLELAYLMQGAITLYSESEREFMVPTNTGTIRLSRRGNFLELSMLPAETGRWGGDEGPLLRLPSEVFFEGISSLVEEAFAFVDSTFASDEFVRIFIYQLETFWKVVSWLATGRLITLVIPRNLTQKTPPSPVR